MGFKINKQYRLPGYNYSSSGAYFVTICTKDRVEFFGSIKNKIMCLNKIGCLAARFWQEIPNHFSNCKLGEWVIMPNHIHGIIIIENNDDEKEENLFNMVGIRHGEFLPIFKNKFGPLVPKSLSSIINQFKGSVKRWCNQNDHEYFSWQPRFHDRIIRDQNEYARIAEYIVNNPAMWQKDRNHLS